MLQGTLTLFSDLASPCSKYVIRGIHGEHVAQTENADRAGHAQRRGGAVCKRRARREVD